MSKEEVQRIIEAQNRARKFVTQHGRGQGGFFDNSLDEIVVEEQKQNSPRATDKQPQVVIVKTLTGKRVVIIPGMKKPVKLDEDRKYHFIGLN